MHHVFLFFPIPSDVCVCSSHLTVLSTHSAHPVCVPILPPTRYYFKDTSSVVTKLRQVYYLVHCNIRSSPRCINSDGQPRLLLRSKVRVSSPDMLWDFFVLKQIDCRKRLLLCVCIIKIRRRSTTEASAVRTVLEMKIESGAVVWRGEKRLLCDSVSELRLGRKKEKITEGR